MKLFLKLFQIINPVSARRKQKMNNIREEGHEKGDKI